MRDLENFIKLQRGGLLEKFLEGHNRKRLINFAISLGNCLDLCQQDKFLLLIGAQLHDAGKICLPAEILQKEGELSGNERNIMKQHAAFGGAILLYMGFSAPIVEVALYHHERFDGTGYFSRGGENIPLLARAMSVIDVLDALCSERPYHKARTLASALDYIRERSGSQFDPRIVDLLPIILAIH